MAKRTAIDEIYRQSEAAGKTAKKKASTAVRRQSGKTAKPFKATYYVTEAARSALEQERHARSMTGRREGSDLSSLVNDAILKVYGRKRGSK